MPNVNSGPISSVEAPKPAVTFPFCSVVSSPAHPIEDIHTLSHTRGLPLASRISLRIGAVFGSSAMESNVETFTCPCMFDCPARMKTFSGLAVATADIRPTTTAIIRHFTLRVSILMAGLMFLGFGSIAGHGDIGEEFLIDQPTVVISYASSGDSTGAAHSPGRPTGRTHPAMGCYRRHERAVFAGRSVARWPDRA